MDRELLILDPQGFIKEGAGRYVYEHPYRDDCLIKIHKPLAIKPFQTLRTLVRYRRRRFGQILNSYVEIDEIAAIVGRTGQVPEFCSQFLGFVATNLGPGALFEAVRSPQGEIATTLERHAIDVGSEPRMIEAIDALWDQIQDARAVMSDPNLGNVVVTSESHGGYRLIVVDGLGERTWIKVLRNSDRAYYGDVARKRAKMKQSYHEHTQLPRGETNGQP